MKKFLTILCACLLLTGCGNSSETDETTSQTETNQKHCRRTRRSDGKW